MSPIWIFLRLLAIAALAGAALGAAFMFVAGAAIASDPEYFGEPDVDIDLFLLGLAGGFLGACVAIYALAKRSVVAAAVGGVAIAAAAVLLIGVLEASDAEGEDLRFYRAVFALAILLDAFVVLLAWRLRPATPRDARAR